MAGVQRYTATPLRGPTGHILAAGFEPDDYGECVRYGDYTALQARVTQLEADANIYQEQARLHARRLAGLAAALSTERTTKDAIVRVLAHLDGDLHTEARYLLEHREEVRALLATVGPPEPKAPRAPEK